MKIEKSNGGAHVRAPPLLFSISQALILRASRRLRGLSRFTCDEFDRIEHLVCDRQVAIAGN
jgi:hypothetical protein